MAKRTVARRFGLMGYRSEVAIVLTKDLFEQIKSELEEDDKNDLETAVAEESKEQVLIHFEWIKWYEDYPLVRTVENNIKKNPAKSRLLRIGEEWEDFQEMGSLDDDFDMCVNRSISYSNAF